MKRKIGLILVISMLVSLMAFSTVASAAAPVHTATIPLSDGETTIGNLVVEDYGLLDRRIAYHFDVDPLRLEGYSVDYHVKIHNTHFTTETGEKPWADLLLSEGATFSVMGSITLTPDENSEGLIQRMYVVSDGNNILQGEGTTQVIDASDANLTAWGSGYEGWIGFPLQTLVGREGAQLIWSDSPVVYGTDGGKALSGDVVEFERSFTVPGMPVAAHITAAADNGLELRLKTGDTSTFLYKTFSLSDGWRVSDLTRNYVDERPWDVEYSEDLPFALIQQGSNILQVTGVNESMIDNPPDDRYNPSGFIYILSIDYVAGEMFDGNGSMTLDRTTTPPETQNPPPVAPPAPPQQTNVALVLTVEGPGTAAPGAGAYGQNSIIVFSVTPDANASFVGWFGPDGDEITADNRLTMNTSKEVIARFAVPEVVLPTPAPLPEAVPTPTPMPIPTPAPDAEIEDEIMEPTVPEAAPELPKTSGLPQLWLTGLGALITSVGVSIRKNNKK